MTADRPRDRLGRPLPIGSADEGPPVPSVGGLTDAEVWTLATGLIAQGLPFHAHEVFEERWRACPDQDRAAWRALAQWGAALTHEARGNTVGAERLAGRALETLDEAGTVPDAIDVASVRAGCARLIDPLG